jgi:hypothetical protein
MIKLKELLEKYGSDIHFYKEIVNCEAICENGEITIKYIPNKTYSNTITNADGQFIDYNISLEGAFQSDAEVELNCYWYYGGLARARKTAFETAFKRKDYNLFKATKKALLDTESYWCSPQTISLSINGEPFGSIDYIDEFLFQHIDFQECEHG